jgi:putative PIN family toxin of toxin-antitoxin system
MKVLLDTNVIVSAVLRDRAPEAVILWIAGQPDWEWMVSDEILAEYRSVLGRKKFALPAEILADWEAIFATFTHNVESAEKLDFPRDQQDAAFLACALACGADYLVTGDRDFGGPAKFGTTTILSVALFRRIVIGGE